MLRKIFYWEVPPNVANISTFTLRPDDFLQHTVIILLNKDEVSGVT